MMADVSPGGARLRSQVAIPPGTVVDVAGYQEPFVGVVRYCTPGLFGLLVGLQRTDDSRSPAGLPRNAVIDEE